MIQILRQLLNTKWLMEPAAAKQWGAVAIQFLNGDLTPEAFTQRKQEITAGVPVKWDVRRGGYSNFMRADENGNYNAKGPVQIVMIDSPIMKYDYCGSAGTMTMGQAIMAANQDDSVQSIVLYIDSPGGSVDGTEALANLVKGSQKPVVSYVNSCMCSGAYWVGSAAKMIVSDGSNKGYNATIGSIGTMCSWIDRKGVYEQQGAVVHAVYATESVDKNGDARKANSGDYSQLIQEVLDPLNETFLSAVKENRAGKINLDKENVLTGKTYNAKEAMKFGLIDKIGSFEMAIKESLTLAKKQKKMEQSVTAFNRTLTASQAESFDVVENGFLLTEENLNNIEAHISGLETAAADAGTNATTAQTALQAANDQNAQLTADLATANTRIEELTAEVARLNQATPPVTGTSKTEDSFEETAEVSDVTKEANKLRAMKGLAPIK